MKTALFYSDNDLWVPHLLNEYPAGNEAQLVLCFGAKEALSPPAAYQTLRQKFPSAIIAMCSTAGQIFHETVMDNGLVAVAMAFSKTPLTAATVNIQHYSSSYEAATALVNQLPKENLAYILVLSDGSLVNGSELVKGLNDASEHKMLITGGLAGDGAHFTSTLTGLNKQPEEGNIIAIGFYGNNIHVTHGSQGGWDVFGPEREVTRSNGNILFEIDNKNALNLYKKYLGPDASNLPGSALLFPLSVIVPGSTQPVVRTILSIDNEAQSMTFAGDIPESSVIRFMKANFDQLTQAASKAAMAASLSEQQKPGFSLLISCVGRKLILGSRTEEEAEAVNELFGGETLQAGFYSYGEISPFNEGGNCLLHNQTMTITSFYELS